MLCEECGERQAEVVMTTVINGESTSRHLCRECLKKYQTGDLQSVRAAGLSAMAESSSRRRTSSAPAAGKPTPSSRRRACWAARSATPLSAGN